jgi:hypothetical protein
MHTFNYSESLIHNHRFIFDQLEAPKERTPETQKLIDDSLKEIAGAVENPDVGKDIESALEENKKAMTKTSEKISNIIEEGKTPDIAGQNKPSATEYSFEKGTTVISGHKADATEYSFEKGETITASASSGQRAKAMESNIKSTGEVSRETVLISALEKELAETAGRKGVKATAEKYGVSGFFKIMGTIEIAQALRKYDTDRAGTLSEIAKVIAERGDKDKLDKLANPR